MTTPAASHHRTYMNYCPLDQLQTRLLPLESYLVLH